MPPFCKPILMPESTRMSKYKSTVQDPSFMALSTLLTRVRMLSFTPGNTNLRMKRTLLTSSHCVKISLLSSQQLNITSVLTLWWTWLLRKVASPLWLVSSRLLTLIHSSRTPRPLLNGQLSSLTLTWFSLKLLAANKRSWRSLLQVTSSTKVWLTIVFTDATDSTEWLKTALNPLTWRSCGVLCHSLISLLQLTTPTDGVSLTTATLTLKTQQTAGSQSSAPKLPLAHLASCSGLPPSSGVTPCS